MSETGRILIRMRDVGLALQATNNQRQHLNRIQLQKFIYLMDALSRLYEMLPSKEGHITYRHGPFDVAIQNAVDALSFRGLVKIATISHHTDKSVSAEYRLTDVGRQWATKLQAESEGRWNVARTVARHVDALGWSRLVTLVYSEPTFVAARSQGLGRPLETSDGLTDSSASLIQTLEEVLLKGFEGIVLDREFLADLFFDYLERYSALGTTTTIHQKSDILLRGTLTQTF